MILKMFAVYDSKTEAYMQPFFVNSTGGAIRAFENSVNTKDELFNKYPADFTLFEIGAFDDQTGQVETLKTHTNLCNAIECVQQKEIDLNQPEMLKQQAQ